MKKIFKLFILLFCILLLNGCGNNTNTTIDNTMEFQSKVVKNNNSYDVNDHKKIKDLTISFEKELLDWHIDIKSISFEYSEYNHGIYQTAYFKINDDDHINLKFDKDGNLILIYLGGEYFSENTDSVYSDCKNAMKNFKYFDFNSEDQDEIDSLASEDKEIQIGNFEIEEGDYYFIITDKRYKNSQGISN